MSKTVVSTLFILRHAHSAPASPGQPDHLRELDERGRGEAASIGAEMAASGYRPERIVCSSAVRTRETLERLGLPLSGVSIDLSDSLYAGGVPAYLRAVQDLGPATAALLVGHNPMVTDFLTLLVGEGEAEAMTQRQAGFPTAGLAVVEFSSSLPAIAAGQGFLRRMLDSRKL